MKQLTTGRMVATLVLLVGMLAGSIPFGATTLNGSTLTLASYYTTDPLAVEAPTTISVSRNFFSIWDGALTGSSNLTLNTSGSGYIGGTGAGTGQQLSLINNSGNTFSGDITINSGVLRIAGNPFATGTAQQGFIAPSMGSGSTITIGVGGSLLIDDNAFTGGYVADRFGSGGNRPAVDLKGGTLSLSGINNASSSVQNFGSLTASSGLSVVNVTRNSSGSPVLQFDSFTRNSGAAVTFNDNGTSTMGANNTAAPRVLFTTGPTLINGILAGARYHNVTAGGVGNFVTYGTDGIRQFTASDYTDLTNNINLAAASDNVHFNGAATDTYAALDGPTTVNSLHIAPSANPGTWAMGNTLTLTSGMLMKVGHNHTTEITSGTLTAGNGVDDIDLHIMIQQSNLTINNTAVIADNGDSAVTLVKSEAQGNTLSLSGNQDNTYSGGTYLLGGALNTGSTADRRYLGSGPVVVDNGRIGGNANTILGLGSRGATSYSGPGADYTAINGGRINLANIAYTADDTFDIGAGSIIHGNTTPLNSLIRGTNISLAEDVIISHANVISAPLNLTTGTIQGLGTNADLYYGLGVSQNNAGGSVTIGTGTAFKGIATPRGNFNWDLGTINVASGTSDVYLFNNSPDRNPDVFQIGNGATAGAPVITLTDAGTVNFNVLGRVRFNDSDFVFGDTSNSRNVRFVSAAGSTLEFIANNGMGSGTGIASALVEAGGTLRYNGGGDSATALNGNVTFQSGGRYEAMLTSGITGSGQLTFEEGSIIQVNSALGFSGSQASAADIAAGTIVRLNVNSFGAAGETLDSVLGSGSKHVSYVITGGNNAVNPSSGPTAVYTLNKSAGGVGGILVNDSANRTVNALSNGNITLGANGGVIASTTGYTLTVNEDITGSGSLTIGTTNIIDGAPKAGIVSLNAANNYTGGTIVDAGTLTMGNATALGSNTGTLTVNGGTLNMNNQSLTVGNLTGTGGTISGTSGNRTLTIGNGDFGGSNFEGVIANGTGGTTALTKTGTGTNTLSGANTYTGVTAVNGGTLLIDGNQSAATNNLTVADGATLGGKGIIGGNVIIANNGRLTFHLSTVADSHDKLELAAGKSLTFSGASVLDITATDLLTAPGVYTLVTAPGGIIGTLPATLNLPAGYTATVQQTGNDLELNVTAVPVVGGPSVFMIR
jgi:fibronectin-binding autotransporter adhesin